MPWGKTNIPLPKLFKSLPDGSNSRIGSSVFPAHEFPPHRSPTHMWPFGSMSTALVDPHVRPSASLNQFSTVRYGFGSELGCAPAAARNINAAVLTPHLQFVILAVDCIVTCKHCKTPMKEL